MNNTGVGFQNPLFFIGVVEENEDPRLESRVKVRVFGVHGTHDDISTDDLPWATLIIGSHDTNFVVPPLNVFVFGFFLDGRDAQQPMILGLIPNKYEQLIDPSVTGWGTPLGTDVDRASMSRRHEDYGQPTSSRLARGENLDETYNLALETNRAKEIDIAGGGVTGHASMGNTNSWAQDESSAGGAQSGGAAEGTPAGATEPPATGPDAYAEDAKAAAIAAGVPPDLYYRLIKQESNWNPSAKNKRSGAYGMTQVMPATAAKPGYGIRPLTDINNPKEQLRFGAEYLAAMKRATGSWAGATAAYNAGPGNVQKYGGTPPFKETQDYVNIIHGGWQKAGAPGSDIAPGSHTSGGGSQPSAGGSSGSAGGGGGGGKKTTWEEPASGYAAQYPYNRVIETPGGVVVEYDSTPGAERVMMWHPSGSYVQMTPSSTTHKSAKDMYSVNESNYHMLIGGNNIVTINGNSHVLIKGNKVEEITGNYTQIIHGSASIGAANQININGGTETQIRSARLDLESNVENLNLKVGKKIVISSGGELHLKSKGVFIEAEADMSIKSGANLFVEAAADGNMKAVNMFMEATSNMNVKGGPAVKISASQLDLNGSGTVNIEGSPVNLASGAATASGAGSAKSAEAAADVEMKEPPAPDIQNDKPAPGDSSAAGGANSGQAAEADNGMASVGGGGGANSGRAAERSNSTTAPSNKYGPETPPGWTIDQTQHVFDLDQVTGISRQWQGPVQETPRIDLDNLPEGWEVK